MNAKTICAPKTTVNDHIAHMLCQMAEKYYSDPENIQKYAEWHFKEYGCWPDDMRGGHKNERA